MSQGQQKASLKNISKHMQRQKTGVRSHQIMHEGESDYMGLDLVAEFVKLDDPLEFEILSHDVI